MNYFIADPHFGHANIIRLCNRPFATVEEMDAAMVERWNGKVTAADTVYVLGDLFYRAAEVEPVLKSLKGRKHLILGNHDPSWTDRVDLSRYFESVQSSMELNDGNRMMTLCHYPMLSWRSAKRTYMVYGHIHNNIRDDYWPLIMRRPRMLNAGVELNNYEPVTFEELVANNEAFRKANADAAKLNPLDCFCAEA